MLFDEVLSYSYEDSIEKIRKGVLIDTITQKVFVPLAKYECLLGKDKEVATDLLVLKN